MCVHDMQLSVTGSPWTGICSTANPASNMLSTQIVAMEVNALLGNFQSRNIVFSCSAAATSVMQDCFWTTLQPRRSNLSFDERIRGREDNTDRTSISLPAGFITFAIATFFVSVTRQSSDPSTCYLWSYQLSSTFHQHNFCSIRQKERNSLRCLTDHLRHPTCLLALHSDNFLLSEIFGSSQLLLPFVAIFCK